MLRWYIDGACVYEVDAEALRAQTNSSGERPRGLPCRYACKQALELLEQLL